MTIFSDIGADLTMLGVAATVIFLFMWVSRSLDNPLKRRAFDEAIQFVQGGSELDIDTALNKSNAAPKLSPIKDWSAYWLDQYRKAGMDPADPAVPGRVAIGAAIVTPVVLYLLLGPLYIVPGALAGPILLKVYTGMGVRKRTLTMEKQLPSLLSGLRANLQAGNTPQQAIVQVAADLPSPLGDELRELVEELNVSTTLEVALRRLADRVPSREMKFLVASIEIAVQSGSDLDPQLQVIEQIVIQRARIRSKLRAAVAQVKPTAMLAYGAVPGMFVFSGLRNAENRAYWFGSGIYILVVAAILYVACVFVIRTMVKSVENA